MKKLLLTAAAVSILSTSSAYAASDFYVKANAGWFKLNDAKIKGAFNIPAANLNAKSSVHVGVGAGYHLQEDARAEIMLDHYINPKFNDSIINTRNGGKATSQVKTNINTLMLNGYYDIFTIDALKVFIGAGFGLSHTKSTVTQKATIRSNNSAAIISGSKKSNNINATLAGYIGAGYEITKGLVADLSYSYKHLGALGDDNTGAIRGHHVTAGIRFDI
jgi:opacity protein-like surface antigen